MANEFDMIESVIEEFKYKSQELFSFASSHKCRGALMTVYSSMVELTSCVEKEFVFIPKNKLDLEIFPPTDYIHNYTDIYDPNESFVLRFMVKIDHDLAKQNKDDGVTQTLIIGRHAYKTVKPIYDDNGKELKGDIHTGSGKTLQLNNKNVVLCNNCSAKLKHHKKCSGCLSVAYCDKKCQIVDWKAHKLACKSLGEKFNNLRKLLIEKAQKN